MKGSRYVHHAYHYEEKDVFISRVHTEYFKYMMYLQFSNSAWNINPSTLDRPRRVFFKATCEVACCTFEKIIIVLLLVMKSSLTQACPEESLTCIRLGRGTRNEITPTLCTIMRHSQTVCIGCTRTRASGNSNYTVRTWGIGGEDGICEWKLIVHQTSLSCLTLRNGVKCDHHRGIPGSRVAEFMGILSASH